MGTSICLMAKRFGLSRSTLLYYDSIGLLSPSERSDSNYRLYSGADVERMELIDVYRRAGLPLVDISRVLSSDPGTLTEPVVAFTTRWEWVPGEEIQPYDCAVH